MKQGTVTIDNNKNSSAAIKNTSSDNKDNDNSNNENEATVKDDHMTSISEEGTKQTENNPLKRSSPTIIPPYNHPVIVISSPPCSPGGRQIVFANPHPPVASVYHSPLLLPFSLPRPRSFSLHSNSNMAPPVSPMTTLSLPDLTVSPTKKAVDAAIANERSRVKELEKLEAEASKEELRLALKKERSHSLRLAGELAALRSSQVQSQAEAEICEEGRINSLMRRLDDLQREKGRIIVELEREEEMLTNSLQKKLNEVRREKAVLEKQLEHEHLDLKHVYSLSTTKGGAASMQE